MAVKSAVYSNQIFFQTYLKQAIHERNVSRMQACLARGDDPNSTFGDGNPPLVMALEMGFEEGADILLSHNKINVNRKGRGGVAALHIAAEKGYLSVIDRIFGKGGFMNIRDAEMQAPLHYAAKANQACAVRKLTSKKEAAILIDPYDKENTTPLIAACCRRNWDVAEALFDEGAKGLVRNDKGFTAKTICIFQGYHRLSEKMPYDPNITEFIKRKVVSHFHGFDQTSELQGKKFQLSGAFAPLMHEQIALNLESFFLECTQPSQFSHRHRQILLEAFYWAGIDNSSDVILERASKRGLTIIPAGWDQHAIDIVFFGSYMAICNRGEGIPWRCATIEAFKIAPSLITREIIDKIREQNLKKAVEASEFFYFGLPKALSKAGVVIQDQRCCLLKIMAPKPIKTGICTLACGKAALRCAGILLKTENLHPKNYQDIAKAVKYETKTWSLYSRVKVLKGYLDGHFKDSFFLGKLEVPMGTPGIVPDMQLIQRSWQVIKEKIQRNDNWAFPVIPHYDQVARRYLSVIKT